MAASEDANSGSMGDLLCKGMDLGGPAAGKGRGRARLYGAAGLFGVSAFLLSLFVLHLLGPKVDVTRHYVSEFANGPIGWLFIGAAAVHGTGNLALSVGLRRSLGGSGIAASAAMLFGVAATGIIIAAFFPTDGTGQARTAVGEVHRLATMTSFAIELFALFLFSAAFLASAVWRSLAALSFTWSAIATAMVAWLVYAVSTARSPRTCGTVCAVGFPRLGTRSGPQARGFP